MSQSALWAVMRAYNIPDADLLEAIYSRTTACMDPEDARCAIITFLTGVIQGGASFPRIFVVFINALLAVPPVCHKNKRSISRAQAEH
jgi:hypothetical protein